MSEKLFEYLSYPVLAIGTLPSGYVLYDDGSYYYEKEDAFLTDEFRKDKIVEYLKNVQTKMNEHLLFKSKELADKVKEIIDSNKTELQKIPNELHNPMILDGDHNYIRFGTKIIEGGNILTGLSYKKIENKKCCDASLYHIEFENELDFVRNLFIEISDVIKEYQSKNEL